MDHYDPDFPKDLGDVVHELEEVQRTTWDINQQIRAFGKEASLARGLIVALLFYLSYKEGLFIDARIWWTDFAASIAGWWSYVTG